MLNAISCTVFRMSIVAIANTVWLQMLVVYDPATGPLLAGVNLTFL